MSTRVYLPLTSTALAALVADGRLEGPRRAHAVTAALRAAWPDGDQEEWEYAALMAAGEESWGARGPGDRPRRHVLAADVPAVEEADDAEDPTLVRVTADVPWRRVASVHVDAEDRGSAGPDEPAPEDDLAWFATQEIADLL